MKRALPAILRAAAASAILLTSISAPAAFVSLPNTTPEIPGVFLGGLTSGLTGSVQIDTTFSFSLPANAYMVNTSGSAALDPTLLTFKGKDITVPFSLVSRYLFAGATVGHSGSPPPFALSGTLRFLAVDRGAGLQDFYFQIANTSPGPDPSGNLDLFRFTIGGFNFGSEAISVASTNSLAGLTSNMGPPSFVGGTVAPSTADRDVAFAGSLGFDFPAQPPVPFTGKPGDLNVGEVSNFIVVRTNRVASPLDFQVLISGSDTLVINSPTAVPEPTSAIFGMFCCGAMFLRRSRA